MRIKKVLSSTKAGVLIVMSILSFFGCASEPGLKEGGIYATAGESGGYTVLKILKIDDHGVHIRLYSNVYESFPESIDESALYMAGVDRKPNEALGMGHAPISKQSFSTWGARFIQQSSVSDSELEGYKMWLEASGGYF
jgi:hypothetical protein